MKEALFDNAETKSFENELELDVKLGAAAGNSGSNSAGALTGAGKDVKGVVTYMAILKDSVVGPVEVPFRYTVGADGALVAKSTKLVESAGAASELKKASIDLDNPGVCLEFLWAL
jgi:hypothetical protein